MTRRFKIIDILLLMVMLALFAYTNSLDNPFLFDDYDLFLQDRSAHSWGGISQLLVPKLGGGAYYRPLAHIIPGICYILFHDNAYWYHITSVMMLALAACVVFFVLRYILEKEVAALICALLFCVHPINGLLVNYITASVFSIQVIFMMLSLYFFVRLCRGERNWTYAASLAFWIGSLLCHETAMVMPFYFFLTAFFVLKERLLKVWRPLASSFLLLLLYFLFRLQFASLQSSVINKMVVADISLWQFTASFFQVIMYTLKSLFLLKDIVFIRTIDVVRHNVFFYCAGFLGFVVCVITALLKTWRRLPRVFLGLSWFIIGFVPVVFASFLRLEIGFIFEPHWMYFANIGIFILIALVLNDILERKKIIGVMGSAVIVCACLLSGWHYNYLWGEPLRYLNYWSSFAPKHAGIKFWTGECYWEQGNIEKAKRLFFASIEKKRSDWKAYNNLGVIALDQGEIDKADIYFHQAFESSNGSYLPRINLALVALKRRKSDEAKVWLQGAIEKEPSSVEARWVLAKTLESEGRLQEAERYWVEACELDRTDKRSVREVIEFYFRNNRVLDSKPFLKKYLLLEKQPHPLMEMASSLGLKGEFSMALAFYQRALENDSSNALVYLEMGKLFGNYNQFDKAIEVWEKGSAMAPRYADKFQVLIERAEALKKQYSEL